MPLVLFYLPCFTTVLPFLIPVFLLSYHLLSPLSAGARKKVPAQILYHSFVSIYTLVLMHLMMLQCGCM